MKNVILDFNLLIKAEYDNTFKTGIYYVQYNVIKNLIENYSDRFNFFAFSHCSEKTFYRIISRHYPEFKSVKYFNIFSRSKYFKNIILFHIRQLRREKHAEKNTFKKIYLTFKINFLKLIKLLIPSSTNSKNVEGIDIYQSFYEDIPNEIAKNNGIKKFIFVHDLLPITHSEYMASTNSPEKTKNSCIKKIHNIEKDTTFFIISEYTKNEFLKIFPKFKNSNIVVNLLAADNRKYHRLENLSTNEKQSVLEKYHIPSNEKYILSLCSLNKRKNLAFLVECFVDFLEKNKNVVDLNLVLAGPKGWLMDEMFKSIEKAEKYRDKIIITGFIDDDDINIIYNSAFMFVFPSFAEGFGLPVLEAMQCGIPVISSNTTSLPEVYGDAAIGISPTSVEELEKSIHEIYFNNDIRNKLIEDGLKQSKKFSWKKTVDNIVNEYLN